MKRILSLFMVIAMLLSVTACSSPKPHTVVEKFCDAMKKFDIQVMSECVKGGMGPDDIFGEDSDDMEQALLDYMKKCAENIKYKVVSAAMDGDKGEVTVEFTYKDFGPAVNAALEEMMIELFAAAFSEDYDESALTEKFMTALNNKSDASKMNDVTKTVKFNCEKSGKDWLISEVPEDVMHVLSANIMNAFEDFYNEPDDFWGDYDDDEFTPGQDATSAVFPGEITALEDYDITVTDCVETTELFGEYSKDTAESGMKFVVYSVEVSNTSNNALYFGAMDVDFYDSTDRYYSYFNTWSLDDVLYYEEIFPGNTASGTLVFQVPEDCSGYYFVLPKPAGDGYYAFYGSGTSGGNARSVAGYPENMAGESLYMISWGEHIPNPEYDTELFSVVVVTNVGDTNLYISGASFEYENIDGGLLEIAEYAKSIPDVIAPGEDAYIYSTVYFDSPEALEEVYDMVPRLTIYKTSAEAKYLSVSDVSISRDGYSTRVIGRLTNDTDVTVSSYATVGVFFLDTEGYLMYIDYTFPSKDLAPGETAAFEYSTYDSSFIPEEEIGDCVFIVQDSYWGYAEYELATEVSW